MVPLHLLVFLGLYAGMVRVTLVEVGRAHEQDTRVMLEEGIRGLHPAMISADAPQVRAQLARYIKLHELMGFQLYDSRGRPVASAGGVDPQVVAFLRGRKDKTYGIVRRGGTTVQHTLMRVKSGAECAPCHEKGATIGAASITRDLGASLQATRRRVFTRIGVLAVGWLFLVAALNVVLAGVGRRTVENLAGSSRRVVGPPAFVLDPISSELYRSLRETLEAQRRERDELADRFEQTERLAALGKLAAGLAHEIKNPLAGVQGALQLLIEECERDDRIDLFKRMLHEIERIDETVQSLLHFVRPRPPKRAPTDLVRLLHDVAALLRPNCSKKGIALEVEAAPDLELFRLDREQIRQVLVNLVTNAMEAMDHGGTVTLRAAPFPDGQGVILVAEDTGPGIAPEVRENLFEPFVTTKMHGTGLGLAVVRRIVEEHGGTVRVTSSPGRGTIFHVLLPAEIQTGEVTDGAHPSG